MDRDLMALTMSAERQWLQSWQRGPTIEGNPLRRGEMAPDVELFAPDGAPVRLADAWADGPALVLLWRHLGCGCGRERARRLLEEMDGYEAAGLKVMVVAPGDPERVADYAERNGLTGRIMADPGYEAHRAFGLGHWSLEQVLYDDPEEFCDLKLETGRALQEERRTQGRPLVDDPWMQSGEFVVGGNGVIRVAYAYNYCEDYPNPRVFVTAARLSLT
ncbi:MAG: AhpC/TSA family protein [Actinobacteria bacterium]|nr:AhpC/TSA family protein [Actinomycetota bacterium]